MSGSFAKFQKSASKCGKNHVKLKLQVSCQIIFKRWLSGKTFILLIIFRLQLPVEFLLNNL